MQEVFIDIPDFVGFYQVSNRGTVKSIDRAIVDKKGVTQHFKGQTLTPVKTVGGYLEVNLYKNRKRYVYLIHRLVAQLFIGDCPEGMEVDHINRDNTDNRVENLRYVTHPENCKNRDNNREYLKKRVFQYTLSGQFVREHPSITEAANAVGGFKTNISACCLGKANYAYGFKWKYAT